MHLPLRLIAGLALGQLTRSSAVIPHYFRDAHTSPRNISSSQVQRELGGSLSSQATIFGSDDTRYANATHRWGTYAVPTVQVVITAGAETDIAKIVKYCNQHSIDFLTYTSGHGTPSSLARFNGLQISMENLKNITIQPDGHSAWFQGGGTAGDVNSYLYSQGYVTTTGACDCVGLAGAGFGGGHGKLEGLYGLISDNIRQLNVVLANGTEVRVNSTSHPDLYWAMRGAGHNFGIATSMELGIFPSGPKTWFYKNYIWGGDQLAQVFTAINQLHGNNTTPVNMTKDVGLFFMVPSISTTEPVISWSFIYRGSEAEAAPYFAPFDEITPLNAASGNVPYPELAEAGNSADDQPTCTAVSDRIISTASLYEWNVTAEQQIFDSFKTRIAQNPALTNATYIIHEGYSTEAVQKVDPASSAYPFRDRQFLTQFQGNINDPDLNSEMLAWSKEVEAFWNAGQPGVPRAAYVNYAFGTEPLHEIYGHEPWRLEKLRKLKAAYDPQNRFRYYVPIKRNSTLAQ